MTRRTLGTQLLCTILAALPASAAPMPFAHEGLLVLSSGSVPEPSRPTPRL
ncbi:MAG TPA: hypothetical protein VNB06_20965 [Thermoanaerobaculia bacterium]|nr:hypothetical protein [Thermoanaerobaculia bacterium]